MIKGYNSQDKKKHRSITNNIAEKDYEAIKTMIERSNCHICHDGFTLSNKPTLDRINNEIGHTIQNVKPCCCYCNRYKSDKDDSTRLYMVQLKKYAHQNNFPFTIRKGQEHLYELLRASVRGGPSNVHNRRNIKGETTIKKLKLDDDNKVVAFESLGADGKPHVMTHVTMFDFNSLYPFCFGSIEVPFNPYTGGIMRMPSEPSHYTQDRKEILGIIHNKKNLFLVKLSGSIPKEKWNVRTPGGVSDGATVFNFLPIYMSFDIVTDEKTIGKTMYEYMRKNGIPTDRPERKFTQVLSTYGKLIGITNYYLWFLLNSCYFEIEDIEVMYVFNDNTAFTKFTNKFMNRKTIATTASEKLFSKMIMNSSYCADGMNTENFTRSRMVNSDQAFILQLSPNFVNTTVITPDIRDDKGNIVKHAIYQVELKPKTFSCRTNLTAFVSVISAKTIITLFFIDTQTLE
jgi:hypothetical protein